MSRIEWPKEKTALSKVSASVLGTEGMTVWEGAVRSGKTVYALLAFAAYVSTSRESVFLLSGRTVATAERNCILGEFGILGILGLTDRAYHKVGESRAIRFCSRGVAKTIYVSGASDISAYKAIRGATYGGWFADEINMHDREFVGEALRRTVASSDRRHFWTLNPDNPRHWIYTDYLDIYAAKSEEELRDMGGYAYYHFRPSDNPAMTARKIAALEQTFPVGSYLYRRYVLGERCAAEGLVYSMVTADHFHDLDPMERTEDGSLVCRVTHCAIDFGTDHPTVMLFGGWVRGNRKRWRIVAEYSDERSGKTTSDYYADYCRMCASLGVRPEDVTVAIDPAAKVLRNEFVKNGIPVIKAKNDVLPGIDYTRRVIMSGAVELSSRLSLLRDEMAGYSWDQRASERGEDRPVKIRDDACDTLRYFCYTHIRVYVQ